MDLLIVIGVFGLSALAIWRFVRRVEVKEKVVYVPPRTQPISMPTFFVMPAPQPLEREMPYDPYALDYEVAAKYLIETTNEEWKQRLEQLVNDDEGQS